MLSLSTHIAHTCWIGATVGEVEGKLGGQVRSQGQGWTRGDQVETCYTFHATGMLLKDPSTASGTWAGPVQGQEHVSRAIPSRGGEQGPSLAGSVGEHTGLPEEGRWPFVSSLACGSWRTSIVVGSSGDYGTAGPYLPGRPQNGKAQRQPGRVRWVMEQHDAEPNADG